ncbi:MAG: allantoinase PuuE [Gemmobacter sp.]|nr:allantoinase PuuE [Gemmobacter sp.]
MAVLYDATAEYPRDLVGYGPTPPRAVWPGDARIAVQFVLNYEEGAERSVLDGDASAEQGQSEVFNPPLVAGRSMGMEAMYEFGSRAGVWRVLREFETRGLPMTVFAVANALERNPEVTHAFTALGHEIACHGLRWIHYQNVEEDKEREHMRLAMEAIERMTGQRALGWYTGRDSPNTCRLVADYGGFEYQSDYYGDELPFWMKVQKSDGTAVAQLVVPYTADCNDMRFSLPHGFSYGEPFFAYLRDTFDTLYEEGLESPRMMTVAMHCRLIGRPGRFLALQRFLDHIDRYPGVWVCRRIDLAHHWASLHPAPLV